MQEFSDSHPILFAVGIVLYFVCLWSIVCLIISFVGGWRRLAQHFRHTSKFAGPTWGGRSGYMRWLTHYGRCLTVGADSSGLFLRVMFLFRLGHSPLLVPWSDVTVSKRGEIIFFRYVVLLLGREERIPLTISGNLADKIQAAAGPNWPLEAIA